MNRTIDQLVQINIAQSGDCAPLSHGGTLVKIDVSNFGGGGGTGTINTGVLTGLFYPLVGNPSGFITGFNSGIFVLQSQTGIYTGQFYPLNSNPQNYASGNIGLTGEIPFNLSGRLGTYQGFRIDKQDVDGDYCLTISGHVPSIKFVEDVETTYALIKNSAGTEFNIGYYTGNNIPVNGINLNVNGENEYFAGTDNTNLVSKIHTFYIGNGIGARITALDDGGIATGLLTVSGINAADVNIISRLTRSGFNVITENQTGQFYSINNISGYLISGQSIYGSSEHLTIRTVTGNYTLTSNDCTVLFSGNNLTGTLPSSTVNSGILYNIKNIFGTLFLTGSESLSATTYPYQVTLNKSIQVHNDGSKWWVIDSLATGTLTGVFYPLNSNPSGYITGLNTGNFVTTNNTGNFIINPAWSNLICAPTTLWTGATNVCEDKRILSLTGSSTLAISGLYNGWIGLLQVIQSGSGFNLTMPVNTKVANAGSGIINLTTGISGARDMIGFEYDGNFLYVTVGNNFS